jgi:hypothetical protein
MATADDNLKRLLRMFEEADRELTERAIELEARGAAASAAQRREQRDEARRILAALRKQSAAPAAQLIRDAYREGAKHAEEGLKSAGEGGISRSFGGAHTRAAETLYANLTGSLEDGIAYMGRRVDDAYRRATLEELMKGQLASRTRSETAGRIVQNLRRQGFGAFRDTAGRTWKLRTYAEMAARTATREAQTAGTLNRLVENAFDLVQVHVNAGACQICQQHAGKIYSITGSNSARYEPLITAPPFHPRCTCVISAYVPSLNRGVA